MATDEMKNHLTELRDAKRNKFQELFQQKLSIQRQMDSLQEELIVLDEKIDKLEEGGEVDQNQSSLAMLPLTSNRLLFIRIMTVV